MYLDYTADKKGSRDSVFPGPGAPTHQEFPFSELEQLWEHPILTLVLQFDLLASPNSWSPLSRYGHSNALYFICTYDLSQ